VSHEAAKRYSLRVDSRKRATRITGPTGVTDSLDTNYEIFLLMDDLPGRTKRAVAHGVESVGEFCGLAGGTADEYEIQLGKDHAELLQQLRREQPHRTGATLSERWGETIRRLPVSAENGELVWINAIKSYRRKESEITQAACRRRRGGNPKKGRAYAMHVRAITGWAGRAPVQAWIVGAIGPLDPGDSPDGGGQNPVVEGADMLIGLWDWDRVEGELRCGWRNREIQAPRAGETPRRWHLDTQKADGEKASLDVYKGTGTKKSEITHDSAEKLGFSRSATYHICAKGTRAKTWIRAKGVNFIHLTAAGGIKSGRPLVWERPDMLLSQSDAEQLEGFLYSGWCRDQEPHEEESISGGTIARIKGAEGQHGGEPHEVIQNLEQRVYADDTTAKAEKSGQFETGRHGSGEEGWTYVQRIRTGVDSQGVELKVMFDNSTPHSLILYTAAARAALVPVWGKKLVISPDSGEPEESLCKYAVPLVSWTGSKHWLKARGVGYTVYAGRKKVPHGAAVLFPEMEGKASKAHQAAGMVDLVIGKDQQKWQPPKVCDSQRVEDNLTLMKSEFPPRYIVRETRRTEHKI
jgi:hypothetical protein